MDHQQKYINERSYQLYGLVKEWANSSIKYLLVTNGGGAIATLSFIGTSNKHIDCLTSIALVLFVLGIISVGIHHVIIYKKMQKLFNNWNSLVKSHYEEHYPFKALVEDDARSSKDTLKDTLFAYSSFGCLLLGCIFGGISLLL